MNEAKRVVMVAALSKEALGEVSGFYGAVNMDPFFGYAPESLLLETFKGKWSPVVGKFLGVYRFSVVVPGDRPVFVSLPGLVSDGELTGGTPVPHSLKADGKKRGAKAVESDEVVGHG